MWYYATSGQQQGPVDDAALDQLLVDGVITADTFVWKEGLAEWTPLKQLRALKIAGTPVEDAASATCSMCGKMVGADNLIDLVGLRVCAVCKPKAVQALREGITPTSAIDVAWRDGKNVVAHNEKALPARCCKCNASATEAPIKRKFMWHPPAYYLLILLGLLFYVIAAIIVRKRATVDIYLCAEHAQRRKYFMFGSWGAALLGMILAFVGGGDEMPILLLFGILLIIVSIIAGARGGALLRAARIKDNTIWLAGAGKEFLASLPPYPQSGK